ncbi:mavicyanin-like [Salvia miltiorrhiza]|uniref:mavicyanin-like n=1 Tax=Salvia miltiorrhiza TaxID=226208 RepID=UPI0025ABD529|nr:mavicyanin-like [Salvia miltiorrhiza]
MGGKRIYLLVLMVMICGNCSAGEVHKVGESSGWTNINLAPSYYKSWTASKRFQVGDTILFEYNKEFHNVVRVTHKNFNACNTSAPYAAWGSGNDSFTIRRPGHYYFICGVPNHCWAGQKVDIRVAQHSPGPRPTPSSGPTSKSPLSVAQGPSSPPAHPPKKSASSSLHSHLKLWLGVVVAIGLAL